MVLSGLFGYQFDDIIDLLILESKSTLLRIALIMRKIPIQLQRVIWELSSGRLQQGGMQFFWI